MSFYGIISVDVEFKKGIGDDGRQQVVDTLSEFLSLQFVDYVSATFRDEENFTFGTIEELKGVLQELKDNNKIEHASIYIWNLDEPDDEIYI